MPLSLSNFATLYSRSFKPLSKSEAAQLCWAALSSDLGRVLIPSPAAASTLILSHHF